MAAPTSPSSPRKASKGKGKAAASPVAATPVAAAAPEPMIAEAEGEQDEDEDNDLLNLAESITAKAHALAPGKADDELARQAQLVVKASFDRALLSEALSFPHLAGLLQSLTPSSGPTTRSASRSTPTPAPEEKALQLSLTPLQELTTEGMEPEMIWEQMEMRAGVVVELLDEMFGAGGEEEDGEEGGMAGGDEEEEGDEEDDEEDEEDSEDSEGEYEDGEEEDDDEGEGEDDGPSEGAEPYFRKLAAPAKHPMTMDEDDDEDSGDEPEEDPLADENKDLTLASFDAPGSGRPQRRAPGPPSAVDDTFFSLHDFHVQADEGEFEMTKAMRGDVDDDDEEGDGEDELDLFAPIAGLDGDGDEEEDLDGAGLMYKDFFDPPPRPFVVKGQDDKGKGKKGKGGKHYENLALDSTAPAPPSLSTTNGASAGPSTLLTKKRSVRFSDAVKVKTIAARGGEFDKLVKKFGWEKAEEMYKEMEAAKEAGGEDDEETEEEDDGMPMESDEEEDGDGGEDVEMGEGEEGDDSGEDESDDEEGRETIERLKSSLFDEDENSEDDASTPAASLSRHERRLLALSSQIAALEAENVGAKDWATKGEAKAKDRPINSLLEEDLEYERAGKVVPVITEETTKTIEELIKKRILDNQFDDVIRQRAVDPNAFLPSRYMELQDTKSNKSLAEIYEEDYTTAKEKDAGRVVTHELDKDLEKKHDEIEELFDELAGKLDALSNARFTPKPPKATITTISNVASVTLESALPTTTSTSTLLAPEEVFVPDPTNEDRSDFTPSMKKTARQKRRKARAAMAKSAEKFSQGAKGEKERATKELVGTKGVTVIGKGGKVEGVGKKRKRTDEDDGGRSGVSLKL